MFCNKKERCYYYKFLKIIWAEIVFFFFYVLFFHPVINGGGSLFHLSQMLKKAQRKSEKSFDFFAF